MVKPSGFKNLGLNITQIFKKTVDVRSGESATPPPPYLGLKVAQSSVVTPAQNPAYRLVTVLPP